MCQNLGIWRYIIILHHNHVTLINPFNAPNFYKKGVFFIRKKKGQEMTGKEAKPGIRSQNRFLKTQRSKRKVVSKRQSPPHATSNL